MVLESRRLMVCSYDGVSGGHATFSHVPSVSPKKRVICPRGALGGSGLEAMHTQEVNSVY